MEKLLKSYFNISKAIFSIHSFVRFVTDFWIIWEPIKRFSGINQIDQEAITTFLGNQLEDFKNQLQHCSECFQKPIVKSSRGL